MMTKKNVICKTSTLVLYTNPDIDKNNNITDLNVSVKEISDIIQILHANKASEPDVINHKMLKLCPSKIALPLQIIIQ
jgi:hypothetical protein